MHGPDAGGVSPVRTVPRVLPELPVDAAVDLGTRARFDVTAAFALVEIATGATLLAATSHAAESFDIVANYYSNVVAEEDARERATAEIRRDMVSQLTAFLQRRTAPSAPSA